MKNNLLEQAKALPLDEQIDLVEAIWDHIAENGGVPLPTQARIMTLDEVTAAVASSLQK